VLRQDLEGDFSVQARVFSEIDFAHSPLADFLKDVVMADGLADHRLLPPLGAMEFLLILKL